MFGRDGRYIPASTKKGIVMELKEEDIPLIELSKEHRRALYIMVGIFGLAIGAVLTGIILLII